MAHQYQRGLARAIVHQRRVLQLLEPALRGPARQQCVRHVHGRQVGCWQALGRNGQGLVGVVQCSLKIQAHVAPAELMADQGRRQQDRRRGSAVLVVQEARQGHIDLAQPATCHPLVQQVDQGGGVWQVCVHGVPRAEPANRRSSSSISALGGRSKCTPREGAAMPRRNR